MSLVVEASSISTPASTLLFPLQSTEATLHKVKQQSRFWQIKTKMGPLLLWIQMKLTIHLSLSWCRQMKATKMKSHHFPLLNHETFRKNKLKVSRGQSGNQLSELLWAWGNAGKERQQKEAISTYLQGLLILQHNNCYREAAGSFPSL